MSASIYTEKLVKPDANMLSHDLQGSKKHLDKISAFIAAQHGNLKIEWKFYNQKSGWIMKMFCEERNVLFVVPCQGYFRVAFTFGQKATDQIFASQLPDTIKDELAGAKKYAEGRTIQIEVKSGADLKNILELIKIKMAH